MPWKKAKPAAKKPWTSRYAKPVVERVPFQKVTGSRQQEQIWEAMVNTDAHLVVNALAGTGKTFTMIQGLHRLADRGRCAFVAFNKSIARELQTKVPADVDASTFHSLMNKSVLKAYGRPKLDNYKTSYLLEDTVGAHRYEKMELATKIAIENLVGLCKNTLTEADQDSLDNLCDHYRVEVNGDVEEVYELVSKVLFRSREETGIYDFDDMLWLPVINNLPVERYDVLAVDEAQDLNAVQQAAVKKIVGDKGRVFIVGDVNQAVYGFRGSDVDSIPTLTTWLSSTKRGVVTYPLTQTRRCPKLHVQIAQQLVPTFEAMEEAPEGRFDTVEQEVATTLMQPGDLVVCRLNGPVVSVAFKLLKNGIPANIQGRDIGKGLKAMIRKLKPGSGEGSVLVLLQKLEAYVSKEVTKLRALKRVPEAKIINLEDKQHCIMAFCDGVDTVEQVNERIDKMFVDSEGTGKNCVLLSTVHRAKGLEADTVWVLYPELMPFPKAKLAWEQQQERNIRYVALTRSKDRMVFIPKPQKESVGEEG
jgi:DNA helicase-2/ATP-dependent DNA helicase PcrA